MSSLIYFIFCTIGAVFFSVMLVMVYRRNNKSSISLGILSGLVFWSIIWAVMNLYTVAGYHKVSFHEDQYVVRISALQMSDGTWGSQVQFWDDSDATYPIFPSYVDRCWSDAVAHHAEVLKSRAARPVYRDVLTPYLGSNK